MQQPYIYSIPLESGVVAELPVFNGNRPPPKQGPFGLTQGATICIYVFLIIVLLVGAAGVAISCYYLQPSWSFVDANATWKWTGLGLGCLFVVFALILLLLLACYQMINSSNKPKQKQLLHQQTTRPSTFAPIVSQTRPSIQGVYKISDGSNPIRQIIDKSANSRPQRLSAFSQKRNRIFSASNDYEPYVDDDDDYSDIDEKRSLSRPVTVIKEIHHHHYSTAPPPLQSSSSSQSRPSNQNQANEPMVIRLVSSKGNERQIINTIRNALQNQIVEEDENQIEEQQQQQQDMPQMQHYYNQPPPQVIPVQGGQWVLVDPARQHQNEPQRTIILSARPTRRASNTSNM